MIFSVSALARFTINGLRVAALVFTSNCAGSVSYSVVTTGASFQMTGNPEVNC